MIDLLLGHQIGTMSKAYKETEYEKVKETYAQIEPKLSLSNNGNGNHKKISELEETISQLSKEDLSHKTALEVMTKKAMELEEKSRELEAKLQRFEGSQNSMQKMTDDRLATLEKILKVKPKYKVDIT